MNILLRSFVTAVFLAVLQYRDAESFSCYWCASKNLQYQWQVTGLQLPSSAATSSNFFVDYCDTNPNSTLQATGQCLDFCFSMTITLLNVDGSATAGAAYWVRGCHKDFTNYQYPASSIGTLPSPIGKCEFGNIVRYTNASVAVQTPAAYAWCNVDVQDVNKNAAPCNNPTSISTLSGSTCQVTATKRTCYDCVEGSTTKPCNSGNTNSAGYCYKTDLWINNQHFITRSVSDINPLFPGASGDNTNTQTQPQLQEGRCGKVSVTNMVATRAYAVFSGYDCYCNNADYCNGAIETTVVSVVTMVLSLIVCIAAKL